MVPVLLSSGRQRHSGEEPEPSLFVDFIALVIDCKYSYTVYSDSGNRLFPERKPEPIDLLILTHKVHALDPERRTLSEMSGDLHNREILLIDPYLSFKEVGFLALRNSVNN